MIHMKPTNLIFFLAFLFFNNITAQEGIQTLKDSLNLSITESQRHNILAAIVKHYAKGGQMNKDSMRRYNDTLLDLLEDTPPSKIKSSAKTHRLLANYALPFDEYSILAEDLIQDHFALENFEGVVIEQYYIANKAHMAGEPSSFSHYEKGLDYLEKYEEHFDNNVLCRHQTRYYASLASNFDYVGLFDEAIQISHKALSLAEACQDSASMLYAYRTSGAIIGRAMEQVDFDHDKWSNAEENLIHYLKQTQVFSDALRQNTIRSLAAYNLAYYYSSKDSLELSKYHLNESWNIPDIEWMPRQQYLNHTLSSAIEKKEGFISESLKSLEKAHESAAALNEPLYFFKSKIGLSEWMLEQGRIREAKRHLLPLDTLLLDNLEMRKEYHDLLYQLNHKSGDYKTALMALNDYHLYKDSIDNSKTALSISTLMRRYDRSVADHKIAILEAASIKKTLDYHKKLSFGSIGFFIFAAICALVVMLYKQRLHKSQTQNKEVQQQLFRAQMNPHFIFNTLGSIQSFLLNKGKAKEAAYFLTKFAKLMRQILSQSQHSFISLKEEVNTLNNYLLLQRMRFEDKFNYDIKVDKSLDMLETRVPPMILQPIIENAIEHGKIYNQEKGMVQITIDKSGDHLNIKIVDNGKGLDLKRDVLAKKSKESFSLSIIKQRLAFLSSQFDKIATMSLTHPKKGGTVVDVIIPYVFQAQNQTSLISSKS